VSRAAEDLAAGAERLFAAQNPRLIREESRNRYDARRIDEQIVGECPGHDGTVLRVSIRWPPPGARMTILSIREFVIGPLGERYPSKYGMTIDARVVPRFAAFIGEAMDRLAHAADQAEDQRARSRGDQR
jgi:hypothetical protein